MAAAGGGGDAMPASQPFREEANWRGRTTAWRGGYSGSLVRGRYLPPAQMRGVTFQWNTLSSATQAVNRSSGRDARACASVSGGVAVALRERSGRSSGHCSARRAVRVLGRGRLSRPLPNCDMRPLGRASHFLNQPDWRVRGELGRSAPIRKPLLPCAAEYRLTAGH